MADLRLTAVVGTALLLCLTAIYAGAQQRRGCPQGEFVIDGCVLCSQGFELRPTGNLNPSGETCYACVATDPGPPGDPKKCERFLRDAILDADIGDQRIERSLRWKAGDATKRLADALPPGGSRSCPVDTAIGLLDAMVEQTVAEAPKRIDAEGAIGILEAIGHLADQYALPVELPAMHATVRFKQLNWLGSGGVVAHPNSPVGLVVVQPGLADLLFLDERGGAFVNVAIDVPGGTGPTWAVQNLFLSYATLGEVARAQPSVYVDLTTPPGMPVDDLVFNFEVEDDARFVPPANLVVEADVEADDLLFGGIDGSTVEWAFPERPEPFFGCEAPCEAETPPTRASMSGSIPEVAEDESGCVPGAVARAIKILMGSAAPDIQSLYDDLYDAFVTDLDGTTSEDIVPLKNGYVADLGYPIETRSGPFSAAAVDSVIDALASGSMVEIELFFHDAMGMRTGGHMALVKSITKMSDGSVQVTYVDDGEQDDGERNNEEKVINVKPDGKFNGTDVVHRFLIESRTS